MVDCSDPNTELSREFQSFLWNVLTFLKFFNAGINILP